MTFCTSSLDQSGLPSKEVKKVVVDKGDPVKKITQEINSMPAPRGAVCPMIAGTPYRIVLSYPDGSQVTLNADTSGCGVITDGSQQRVGARTLLSDIRDKAGVKLDVAEAPGGGKRPV